MTFSKYIDFLSTVRTFYITVVFHHSSTGYSSALPCYRPLQSYGRDPGEVTITTPSTGERLKYSKRNISCAQGHIYEKVIQISPYNISPELCYDSGNNRTSPYNQGIFIFQQRFTDMILCPVLRNTGEYPSSVPFAIS